MIVVLIVPRQERKVVTKQKDKDYVARNSNYDATYIIFGAVVA